MKFTKGYWMNQPGVECADCVQIREVKVFPDKVYLYAVPYPQDERGMGGPVLEMFISSPKEDIRSGPTGRRGQYPLPGKLAVVFLYQRAGGAAELDRGLPHGLV